MTALKSSQVPPLTGFANDPFIEEPKPCSLTLTAANGERTFSCPNVSVYDSFVTCDNKDDRTQHYCERCHHAAINGKVDCRECKARGESNKITVIASYPRNIDGNT